MLKNKKTTEKEGSKYARGNHDYRDKWLSKAVKEIAFLEVRETKTSRKDEYEPVLYFRKKKVLQCANSAKAFFTGYLFKPGSRQIVGVTDNDEAQLLYELLIQRVQEIEDGMDKPKKTKTNGVRVQ